MLQHLPWMQSYLTMQVGKSNCASPKPPSRATKPVVP